DRVSAAQLKASRKSKAKTKSTEKSRHHINSPMHVDNNPFRQPAPPAPRDRNDPLSWYIHSRTPDGSEERDQTRYAGPSNSANIPSSTVAMPAPSPASLNPGLIPHPSPANQTATAPPVASNNPEPMNQDEEYDENGFVVMKDKDP
ncbi:hypothetical protein H0H93_004897, partial [Arthromyces matolae]